MYRPVLVAHEDENGLRREGRHRRDALLERGREHERLEGRARLPLSLHREVELALAEIVAAVHGNHFSGGRADGYQRSRRPVRFLEHGLDGPSREFLEPQIDRRLNVEAAAKDAPCSVLLDQLLLHVVDEVGRGSLNSRQVDVGRSGQRCSRSPSEVARGDLVLREHCFQDFQSTCSRSPGIRHRIET